MGVGAGVGFGSEAEAFWPGAVPALETKARISKTIRITGCMERKKGSSSLQTNSFELFSPKSSIGFRPVPGAGTPPPFRLQASSLDPGKRKAGLI
jgi:hypothetical protein